MPRFRKKPVEVEAVRWTGSNEEELEAFAPEVTFGPYRESPFIHTREGAMQVSVGDWIIRGTRGEVYPCKPDAFADTFEEVA